MKVLLALFNPHGTVRGTPFWIGAVILLVVGAVFHWLLYRAVTTSVTLDEWRDVILVTGLPYLLIYPYFCLYGKRLRDTGKSAMWFLLILLVYGVLTLAGTLALHVADDFSIFWDVAKRMEYTPVPFRNNAVPNVEDAVGMQLLVQRLKISFDVSIFWPSLMINAVVSAIASLVFGTRSPMTEGNPYRGEGTHIE